MSDCDLVKNHLISKLLFPGSSTQANSQKISLPIMGVIGRNGDFGIQVVDLISDAIYFAKLFRLKM